MLDSPQPQTIAASVHLERASRLYSSPLDFSDIGHCAKDTPKHFDMEMLFLENLY